jgi:hypothetical protein
LYVKGGQTYARFYEWGGGAAEVALEWLGRPAAFTAVDLRERPGGRLGAVLPLSPWQVQTVRFE